MDTMRQVLSQRAEPLPLASRDPAPQALQRRLMEPPNEEICASRLQCACVVG